MPLKSGSSPETVSENISELHHGDTYAHTAGKFGKARANAQAVAIALSEARKHRAHGGRAAAEAALPPDHQLGMRVPEGGSMCANCRFLVGKRECGNEGFVKWNGGARLPDAADQYCCDLWEGKRRRADGGAVEDDYNTKLNPAEEMAFQAWKQLNAPEDSGADYDLRGAFAAGLSRDPASGHFDDTFKKPNHPTFSVYSQYAKDRPDLAGTWDGDQYIPAMGGAYASGGAVKHALAVARRAKGGKVHVGPIKSPHGGRTDTEEMKVPDGSYVLSADVVSHLGENNSDAGMKRAHEFFGPSGHFAKARSAGGKSSGDGKPVECITAGGEYVIAPETVRAIGGGDLDHGHKVLDAWSMRVRKDHVKTLLQLPPPARD